MPIRLPSPKGILFDMGDTLLEHQEFDFAASLARVLEMAHNPHGVTTEQYAAAAENPDMQALWKQRDASMVDFYWISFERLICDGLGLTFDVPFEEVFNQFWRTGLKTSLEPGIHEVLTHLRSLNIPLGVVSNSSFSSDDLCSQLNLHSLLEPFQFVMSSADYVVRKPHRAIFLTAAVKLGVDPVDIWFIGDSFGLDVLGPSQVGMTPIWYNPKCVTTAGTMVAHTEIRSWREFGTLMKHDAQ